MSEQDIRHSSGNVFADLGLDNPQEELERADLAYHIAKAIARNGWKAKDAAARLGVDAPKISCLTRGRTEGFSIDRLFRLPNLAGTDVTVTVSPPHSGQPGGGHGSPG